MVELPHVLVGVAIASKVGNPALSLPLALASHFVMDLIPHWNPPIYREIKELGRLKPNTTTFIFLDSFAALLIGSFIALQSLPDLSRAVIILLGGFFAVLPDLLEAPYYLMNVTHPLITRLVEFEHALQARAPLIPGILTQVAVSAAAVWWILT